MLPLHYSPVSLAFRPAGRRTTDLPESLAVAAAKSRCNTGLETKGVSIGGERLERNFWSNRRPVGIINSSARVAELADAPGLGPGPERDVGSSPSPRMKRLLRADTARGKQESHRPRMAALMGLLVNDPVARELLFLRRASAFVRGFLAAAANLVLNLFSTHLARIASATLAHGNLLSGHRPESQLLDCRRASGPLAGIGAKKSQGCRSRQAEATIRSDMTGRYWASTTASSLRATTLAPGGRTRKSSSHWP